MGETASSHLKELKDGRPLSKLRSQQEVGDVGLKRKLTGQSSGRVSDPLLSQRHKLRRERILSQSSLRTDSELNFKSVRTTKIVGGGPQNMESRIKARKEISHKLTRVKTQTELGHRSVRESELNIFKTGISGVS